MALPEREAKISPWRVGSYHRCVFAAILNERDASRATIVVNKLRAHGLTMALTGGLAIEERLRTHGRIASPRPLNDLDFVVDGFEMVPESVASNFVVHHVHPFAPPGKTLLQLIDADRAIRVDVFRAYGRTLSRSSRLDADTGPLDVVAIEDLVARTTADICSVLGRRRCLDRKHATAFRRLSGLGQRDRLEESWKDHCEDLPMSFDDAIDSASRLLEANQHLQIDEQYSAAVTPCNRCQAHGSFRPASPESIVRILGYW